MDAHHDIASKDCRVCNRRRVKCDRRLQSCAKCEKRGLTCSGYGVILKWDQGVASRGNLRGKALPVKLTETMLPIASQVSSPKPQRATVESSCELSYEEIGSANLALSVIPLPLVFDQLKSSEQRRLLHHYDCIVAPNMAWANTPENPWRHIIIPLALQSPPLLHAVLAFAAKHINAVSFANSKESASIVSAHTSNNFQQRAMTLLAQEIRQFAAMKTSQYPSNSNEDSSRLHKNALLATMLVLCNVETVWPDSQVWQLHLDAARTVIATHEVPNSSQIDDTTSTFLEQEIFIANTFASTTNFLSPPPSNSFKPNDGKARPSSVFIEFLKLIEMVTSLERQSLKNPILLIDSGVSPYGLRKLFENARSRTLELGKIFQVSGSNDYLHLSRTVNCFYHAGLIYSHRALLKVDALDSALLEQRQLQLIVSKTEIFCALGFTEAVKPTFAQDLVWPLFIAGTEATGDDEQALVVMKLQQAMSETGFSNCQHALEFLKALWQRRANDEVFGIEIDWIGFAREWTGHGRTFLVF